MSVTSALPHWDMTVVYPSLDSPEFERDFASLLETVPEVAALFDRDRVDARTSVPADDQTVAIFEDVTQRLNQLLERLKTIHVYIYSFVTTDSRNDLAQAKMSELQQHMVGVTKLQTRYVGWIGSMKVDELISRSPVARDHAFMLRKTKEEARHQMSPGEESLAVELDLSGGMAWGKLHGNITSQLTASLEQDGKVVKLPMSVIRNLAFDPDRDTRRRAYEAELAAWETVSVPLAAALNSIKGESNTLDARRNWETVLDFALFNNNIDRRTLDAMMEAARSSFPDFRRYLRLKAQVLGLPSLTWYDLFAPVAQNEQEWQYEEATRFLLDQFGSYSDRLRGFAKRAFDQRWIDAEPRPGKRDGAFCVSLRGDESRVLTNYRPTFDGMSTVAHELGHGYHNFNLAARAPLQRVTPMTLAETASIFCETIVREAALERVGQEEQVAILEASLQGNCQIVVDISSRFMFEQGLLERRRTRELSIEELNELMLDTQRATYGDGLDPAVLHPYMWAVKGHYYSVPRPFYNFPYMFGLLFGLGLYARFRSDPEDFRAGYDDLLSCTGLAGAADLAQRFGIDIRRPAFWESSLDIIRMDIDRFAKLVGSFPPAERG